MSSSLQRQFLSNFYLHHQKLGDEHLAARRFDSALVAYAGALELNPVNFLLIARLANLVKTTPEAHEFFGLLEDAVPNLLKARGQSQPVYELSHTASLLNRKIMEAYLACHTLPAIQTPFPANIDQPKTLVLLTCVWGRPQLTEIVLSYYQKLRTQLAGQVNLVLLAVGSEGNASRTLCESFDFDYVEHPNLPLSDKWEAGLKAARQFEPDGVVTIGSDDLVSASLFTRYNQLLDDGVFFCGLVDAFFLDLVERNKLLHWHGYGGLAQERGMPWRLNETLGMGRLYSRVLLDWLDYSLWNGVHVNKGLDGAAKRRLYGLGMQPVLPRHTTPLVYQGASYQFGQLAYRMKDLDICALDVKSPAANVTQMASYNQHKEANTLRSDSWDFLMQVFPADTVEALKKLAL